MKEHHRGFGKETPRDRAFHEARWQREADELNNALVRGIAIKWGLKGLAATPEDVMYKEAVRDNELFDRQLSAEHERWDEMLQKVIGDMRKVRDGAPDAPKHFKLVQLMLGTGLGSAYCAAQNAALEDMGYKDIPSVVIGSSGASGPAPFFVAGQSRRGASMFMNECTTKEFLDFTRRPALDTEVIARGMEHGPKSLDQDAIRASKTEVYAIAANKETHKAEFIDFKKQPNMVDACRASSAIPFFRDAVEINGTRYYDGAFAQLPLEEVLEKFHPTHLLIQPNVAFNLLSSYDFTYTNAERAILWGTTKLGSMASMGTVQEYFRMKENVRHLLEKIGEIHSVKIGVLWPPDEGLWALQNDPDTMRRAILEAYRKTVSDFGEEQPARIEFMPGDIPETEPGDSEIPHRKAA